MMTAVEQHEAFVAKFAAKRKEAAVRAAKAKACAPVSRRIVYVHWRKNAEGREVKLSRLTCGHDVLATGNHEREACSACGIARGRQQGWL